MNYVMPPWLKEAMMIKFGPDIGQAHLLIFLLEMARKQVEKDTKKMNHEQRVNHVLQIMGGATIAADQTPPKLQEVIRDNAGKTK